MDLGRGQVDVPLGLSLTMGTGEKDIRVVSEMKCGLIILQAVFHQLVFDNSPTFKQI